MILTETIANVRNCLLSRAALVIFAFATILASSAAASPAACHSPVKINVATAKRGLQLTASCSGELIISPYSPPNYQFLVSLSTSIKNTGNVTVTGLEITNASYAGITGISPRYPYYIGTLAPGQSVSLGFNFWTQDHTTLNMKATGTAGKTQTFSWSIYPTPWHVIWL